MIQTLTWTKILLFAILKTLKILDRKVGKIEVLENHLCKTQQDLQQSNIVTDGNVKLI